MIKRILALAVASAVTVVANAAGPTAVYDGTAQGNQAYTEMLGLDFTVNTPVWVTQLGVFDNNLDGLGANISVGLYNTNGFSTVIAPVTFTAGTLNPTNAQFLFQNVSPVLLQPGTYSVQAIGFNDTNMNYNTNFAVNNGPNNNSTSPITFNTFGGALSNNNSRYGGTLGQAGNEFANSSTFGAGTLSVTAVPEPSSIALALAGLGVLGVVGRRRRSQV